MMRVNPEAQSTYTLHSMQRGDRNRKHLGNAENLGDILEVILDMKPDKNKNKI